MLLYRSLFHRVRFILDDVHDILSCYLNLYAVIWWNTALLGTISRWWFFQRKELCFRSSVWFFRQRMPLIVIICIPFYCSSWIANWRHDFPYLYLACQYWYVYLYLYVLRKLILAIESDLFLLLYISYRKCEWNFGWYGNEKGWILIFIVTVGFPLGVQMQIFWAPAFSVACRLMIILHASVAVIVECLS